MVRQKLASRQDYILRISAGPDFEHMQLIDPNDEEKPLFVNSPHFSGYLMMRYLNFQGVTTGLEKSSSESSKQLEKNHRPIAYPKSTYFNGRKRRYSMVIQGRFKGDYCGDDVLFGVDSDMGLPNVPGFGLLARISKWLDPSLDVGGDDNPHCFSPFVSAMNALAVYPSSHGLELSRQGKSLSIDDDADAGGYSLPSPSSAGDHESLSSSPSTSIQSIAPRKCPKRSFSIGDSPAADCGDWAFAYTDIPERTDLIFSNQDDAEYAISYERRKKLFGKEQKRKDAIISSDNLYCMDFYGKSFLK